ncbi:MAG: hypothetical protein WAT71_08300, partial [Ignavibacteria bacterium]
MESKNQCNHFNQRNQRFRQNGEIWFRSPTKTFGDDERGTRGMTDFCRRLEINFKFQIANFKFQIANRKISFLKWKVRINVIILISEISGSDKMDKFRLDPRQKHSGMT